MYILNNRGDKLQPCLSPFVGYIGSDKLPLWRFPRNPYSHVKSLAESVREAFCRKDGPESGGGAEYRSLKGNVRKNLLQIFRVKLYWSGDR